MELYIVEDDDIALEQCRDEEMLDKGVKHLGVNRALDAHRRPDAGQAQGTDNRDVAPVIERLNDLRPCSPRGSGISGRHRRVDAEFVNKD